MAYKRKTWTEKFNTQTEPTIETIDKAFADMPAGCKMLIATPKIVDDYIRHIPLGQSSDLATMRRDLAAEYHADYTCPVTSGIFLRIVAEAAYESYQQGAPLEAITPFWRIIDEKSKTAKKLSFGYDFVREQRAKEGLD